MGSVGRISVSDHEMAGGWNTDQTGPGWEIVEGRALASHRRVKLLPTEPLRREWAFRPAVPDSDNDDISMSTSPPSKAIWAGHRRSKITYNIPGAR